MASRSFRARGLALRKTKLGETDLIVTFLADDGSLLRAVAKGARRPKGSLAARIELCAETDLLLAEGRSLHVISDARLACAHAPLRERLERMASAQVVIELAAHVAQEGLEDPRLFDMTRAALAALDAAEGEQATLIAAAYLLKACASAGLRPTFDRCVTCGADLGSGPQARFSHEAGGSLCSSCARMQAAARVPRALLDCCQALLMSPFSVIGQGGAHAREATAALGLADQWVRAHLATGLKSIPFALAALPDPA
ncbi:DNA repair protein RecO [Berryella wangjianweii]|uniref:DNA repair protein RecO n=1 Tax=Berryella wangjianweii TaxID=2734634 RepID=A0A6M8IZ47_9ACTN|nr:DNA repair protein RecO [Berryella wangjianweii]QKF06990.1 DNA repair protein RecO [Berryella wangjianweii]